MDNKMSATIMCLAMMFASVTGIIVFSDSSEATDDGVVEVSTGQELIKAMQDRYEETSNSTGGYNVEIAPVSISITQDIVIDESADFEYIDGIGYVGTKYFSGTIDGNGHTITTSFETDYFYLAEQTLGNTTIKDLHLKVQGGVFSLIMGAGCFVNVSYEGNTAITFEDVIIDSYVDDYSNDSPYVVHAYNCTLNFNGCVNNASYDMSSYAGVFLGGMAVGDMIINFTDCVNNGVITGYRTYLFIGNPSNNTSLQVTVQNCRNDGSITGDMAALFANFGSNETFSQLNDQYADVEELTANIHTTGELGVTISIDPSTNNLTASNGSEGYSYQVSMLVYADVLNDGGTVNFTIALPVGDEGVRVGWFLDKSTAQQKYGFDVNGDYLPIDGSPYSYKAYTVPDQSLTRSNDGQTIYIVDFGDEASNYHLERKPTVRVTVFDSSGSRLGSVQTDSIKTELTPTYTTYIAEFFPGMYSYTILSEGGNVIRDGDKFEFLITPSIGYIIDSVSVNGVILEPGDDNTYSFGNVNADVNVVVTTERSYCTVTTNFENVTMVGSVDSVQYGDSFQATIIPRGGYEISRLTVIMGGQELTVDGNTINIPSVTGNIVIIAEAIADSSVGPKPPLIPDDDDDYVPPVYVPDNSGSGEDNSVTIVACAAAAVVAALMATFLIMEYRKR